MLPPPSIPPVQLPQIELSPDLEPNPNLTAVQDFQITDFDTSSNNSSDLGGSSDLNRSSALGGSSMDNFTFSSSLALSGTSALAGPSSVNLGSETGRQNIKFIMFSPAIPDPRQGENTPTPDILKRKPGRPPKPVQKPRPTALDNMPLRDPDAPRGIRTLSIPSWLGTSSHSNNETDILVSGTLPTSTSQDHTADEPLLVRHIIPEANEGYGGAPIFDDEEDIGTEQFGEDEDASIPPEKNHPTPKWFKDLVDEKLKIVDQRDENGKCIFYETVQNFWIPQKANWFNMVKSEEMIPELAYNPRFFYWDPLAIVKIMCPKCNYYLHRHGVHKRPRRCVDLDSCFWMIGVRYHCSNCKNVSGKTTVTYMSWDMHIINKLPKALQAEFPIVLTHRSGLFEPILALEKSLFQKGVGSKQFSDILQIQHQRKYDQVHLQYLYMIDYFRSALPWKNSIFKPFSLFSDSQGYGGYIPASQWFRDRYDQLIESHLPRMYQYSAMLSARIGSIDHSHKITKHIVQINGTPAFAGLLTFSNEYTEAKEMALVATKAHAQFEGAMNDIRNSLDLYGLEQPYVVYTDNIADKTFLEKCFPSLLKNVQPIDKFSKLRIFQLPEHVTTHIKSSIAQINVALATIQDDLSRLPDGQTIAVGFDSEWNVNKKGNRKTQAGKTAIVSIAYKHQVYVLQIAHLLAKQQFPQGLKNFLLEPRIIKAGRNVLHDLAKLKDEAGLSDPFPGGIDLARLAKECHVAPNAKVGLAELTGLVLKSKLLKDKDIRVRTEWESTTLTPEQRTYAATDAYASLKIFEELEKLKNNGNVPEDAVAGLPVCVHQEDGQKLIAYGSWSELNSHAEAALDGIHINQSGSTRYAAVLIEKLVVPAALIRTHHNRALKDFGTLPFTIICKRSQVQQNIIDGTLIQTQPEIQVPTQVPTQNDLSNSSASVPQTEQRDSSWLSDMDENSSAPGPSLENSTHDFESQAIGQAILNNKQTENVSYTRPSGVLKDIWHVFDMISVPRSHGLRLLLARALRDAIFIVNPDDKLLVEERLKREGSSWEEKLKYSPKYLWKLVRHTVPPPDQLYDLVANIFKTYGSLKDSLTGQPLFNASAWKSAKNILKLIEAGYLSDPPGISLYYEAGLDRKKDGLTVWRCVRGTNSTEGGIHHSIRAAFPDSSISARHAVNRLSDFQLYHNLKVGTKNRTGQVFEGHTDIWTYDELQILVERMRDLVPKSYTIKGWTNGQLYSSTTDVTAGILPIPVQIQTKSGMLPAIQGDVQEKKKHKYLALRQGTQHAVIAVHTTEEKALFSKLMREDPCFNRDNQDPDWKECVKVWNIRYVNGINIFYKVCVNYV